MGAIQTRTSKRTGKPRYTGMVRIVGYPLQSATFDRLTDCRIWMRKREAAMREGRYFPERQEQRRTVAQVIDEYIERHLEDRAPGTRRTRTAHLRWWQRKLGRVRVFDLDRRELSRAIRDLKGGDSISGKPAAASTINRYRASLRHCLSWAVQEGYLGHNPMKGTKSEREPRGRVRFLSIEERDRLLAAAKAVRFRRFYPLVVLALTTGGRQSELLRLRWRDADFERGLVTFHETKNGTRRTVPLTAPAADALRELARMAHTPGDLIFARRGGPGRSIAPYPRHAFELCRAEAELEDFRWHDLRHTYASYLAMSGASQLDLMHLLGHRTLAMVARYAHLSESHAAGVVEKMVGDFLPASLLIHRSQHLRKPV